MGSILSSHTVGQKTCRVQQQVHPHSHKAFVGAWKHPKGALVARNMSAGITRESLFSSSTVGAGTPFKTVQWQKSHVDMASLTGEAHRAAHGSSMADTEAKLVVQLHPRWSNQQAADVAMYADLHGVVLRCMVAGLSSFISQVPPVAVENIRVSQTNLKAKSSKEGQQHTHTCLLVVSGVRLLEVL